MRLFGMGKLFSRLFGSSSSGPQETRITDQDRAVLSLKNQRDKLTQYQKKVKIQLEKERVVAKRLLGEGKREKAKLLLKKKRYLESLLDKTDGQLDNLEQLVQNIEFAEIEVQVVQGLKEGNEALQTLHKIVSLEDVEQVMADTQEAVEYQREIDEVLAGAFTQEDEDAVLQELDEIINEQLPQVPQQTQEEKIANLPEVPNDEPVTEEREEVKPKQEPLLA